MKNFMRSELKWKVATLRSWLIGAACVLFCVVAAGQSKNDAALKARLEEVVKAYANRGAFMGSVLVVEDANVLLDKGFGTADLEWNAPNDPTVKFHIGSLTKQFTAALILQLQDEGKLRVEDPLVKYLPGAPKSWANITIAELLGHTAGLPNFIADPAYRAWSMSSHTPTEELALFRDKPLDFEPGSKFAYSNSNYAVLGVIIEKVSGKSYAQLLRERILTPLGMNDSGLDLDDLVISKRAQGYLPAKDGFSRVRPESMTVAWSVGGMYSTTGDLLRWERGLFGGKVISAAALKAMTTPGKGGYGMGVFVNEENGQTVVGHGGSIEGFNAHLKYFPQRKIAVVVLGNVDVFVADTIAAQLTNVVFGKPVTLPGEQKKVAISKEELQRFVGVYSMPAIGPGFTLTVALSGDSISAQFTGRDVNLLEYQGVKDGHPRFYSPKELAEFEFVPGANGSIASFVLHVAGENIPGDKR
jgi:CubicO group peptidase (beta-lactamase class C family)